jgi:hypothetical protein
MDTDTHHILAIRLIFTVLLPRCWKSEQRLDTEVRKIDSGHRSAAEKRRSWSVLRSVCRSWRQLADEIYDFEGALTRAIEGQHVNTLHFILQKSHITKQAAQNYLETVLKKDKKADSKIVRILSEDDRFNIRKTTFRKILEKCEDAQLVKDIVSHPKNSELSKNLQKEAWFDNTTHFEKILLYFPVIPTSRSIRIAALFNAFDQMTEQNAEIFVQFWQNFHTELYHIHENFIETLLKKNVFVRPILNMIFDENVCRKFKIHTEQFLIHTNPVHIPFLLEKLQPKKEEINLESVLSVCRTEERFRQLFEYFKPDQITLENVLATSWPYNKYIMPILNEIGFRILSAAVERNNIVLFSDLMGLERVTLSEKECHDLISLAIPQSPCCSTVRFTVFKF